MKILFKDKVDLSDELKNEYPEALFCGSREPITEDMKDIEILSVKTTIVDSDLLKKFPDLKWIVNRSNFADNINMKHCEDRNIGIINTYPSTTQVSDWIESRIKKRYYLPYYAICGDCPISEAFKTKFKYIHMLNCKTPESKIRDHLSSTNTLIVAMPLTTHTKGIINKEVFSLLPKGSSLISVSNGLVINNEDLLDAIESGKINHADIDRLNAHKRDELIETGKVTFHKYKSWKHNLDDTEYVESIKEHIDSIIADEPINVLLERHVKEVDVFWD